MFTDSLSWPIWETTLVFKLKPWYAYSWAYKWWSRLTCDGIHPSIPSPARLPTRPSIPSFIHPHTNSPVHPLLLSADSSTYPPSPHPPIHLSIHPSIHPTTGFQVPDSFLGAEHPMTRHLHIVPHTQSGVTLPLCQSDPRPPAPAALSYPVKILPLLWRLLLLYYSKWTRSNSGLNVISNNTRLRIWQTWAQPIALPHP